MSYLAQRSANSYPLWSQARMDPSSLGFRIKEALARGEEWAMIDSVRKASVAGILNLGVSPLEDSELFTIDYSEATTALAQELLLAKTVTEDALWESEGGFKLILTGGVAKYPSSVTGTYKYYTGEEVEIPLVLAQDKPVDFDFPIPSDFDYKESTYFGVLRIWCSDTAIAAGLGTNPQGKYPTLQGGTNQPPYVGFNTLDYQLYQYNKGIEVAHRIGISIQGSTHYKRFGDRELDPSLFLSEEDEVNTNIPFLGYHKLILRGLNEVEEPDEEEVYIKDDGYYRTQKSFISCERVYINGKNRPAIEYDGFNGTVTLQIEDIQHPTKMYPFLPAVSPDASNSFDENGVPLQIDEYLQVEVTKGTKGLAFGHLSPLMLELSSPESEEVAVGSYLDSYFLLFVNGQTYRRFGVDIESEEDNRELLASQWLLDEDGEPYNAVDFAFNYYDARTYILDDTGRVHIYEIGLTPFKAWTLPRTKAIDIEIDPLSHRAMYGETIPVWSWHRILRRPIKRVAILRESPTAIAATAAALADGKLNEPAFRGEYLQDDGTWESVWDGLDVDGNDIWDLTAKHYFSGTDADLPEDSWKDRKFSTSFPYDDSSLGQWNFYCETVLKGDRDVALNLLEVGHDTGVIEEDSYWKTKEALLNREDTNTLHRSCTAVMCESLQALRTLGTEDEPLVDLPYGIYFEGISDNMCLVSKALSGQPAYTVKKYELLSHVYLPWENVFVAPTLTFKEDYEKITFVTPYSAEVIKVLKDD